MSKETDELLAELRREVLALLRDRGDEAWDTVVRAEVLAIIDRHYEDSWDPPHRGEDLTTAGDRLAKIGRRLK